MALDDVVLNTLIAEGVDVPTAYAASVEESAPQPASRKLSKAGIVAAVATVAVLLWLFS
jgi:hypothetical protein